MTIAATMPTTSLVSVPSVESVEPIDPPAATGDPGALGGSVASRTRCASASVRSPDPMSSSTGAKAVCWSFASRPAVWPELLVGLVTL